MPFLFATTYDAPARPPTASSTHKRSASTESTTSTLSTISSSTSSRSPLSLRERRGVTLQLSYSGPPAEAKALEPKGQLELRSDDVPRRRALPMPIAAFDSISAMGEAGAKSSSARDFGMGEDGWTVVTLY